jgi:hypothetical protein
MALRTIAEIDQDVRRGLRAALDHVYFRNHKWQPYLEVQISVESVRQIPLRITAVDLFLSYNQEEVGPIPPLPRSLELTEPGEGVEIRLRKDLFPSFAEELADRQRSEDFFQVRGFLVVESPEYIGQVEFPVDLSYTMR